MIALLCLWLVAPVQAAPELTEVRSDQAWSATSGAVSDRAWWKGFGDPALEDLMADALDRNGDLESARARVRMASGIQVQRFAPLLPQASFESSISTGPYDNSTCASIAQFSQLGAVFDALANDPQSLLTNPGQFGGGGASDRNLCSTASAMLVAGWQIDLFGRNSLAYAAQAHEVAASRGDRDAQVLALTTLIAQSWYDLATSDQQVALLEKQVQAQADLLELIELRYEQGGASALDVLQQRQQVAATRALLPTARAGRDARERQLGALVGRPIEALPEPAASLPRPEGLPGVGTPEQIVAMRPELAAARQRALSARDSRASAHLGLLPTLRLSANAGWTGVFDPDQANNGLFDVMTQNPIWGAGVTLSIPIFGGGATHGRIRQARAAESMAVNGYNQAVANTIAEVDGAIRIDEEQRARREAVEVQASAARSAYDESVERYLAGLDSYLSVLAAQSAHQAADLTLLAARRDAISARIQLHDALGQLGQAGESR